MGILKKNFTINFTQVPNQIISDINVTLSAKGLYLYFISKPENWEFSLNGIVSQLKESRPTVIRIIKELCDAGYMEKDKKRENGKQGVNDYTLHIESNRLRVKKSDSVILTTSNTNSSNTSKEGFLKNEENYYLKNPSPILRTTVRVR